MSEVIFLHKDGTSNVVADCLIENISEIPIKIIRIIYPNKLYAVNKRGELDETDFSVYFTDESSSFRDKEALINRIYEMYQPEIESFQWPQSVPAWAEPRVIYLPDSLNPTEFKPFPGIIGGEIVLCLEFSDEVRNKKLAILHENNYTVITCEFKEPIYKSHARWMRLAFKGKNATLEPYSATEHFIRRIFDSLQYPYQILGPYDVRERFVYTLRFLKDHGFSDHHKNIAKNLLHFFDSDGLIGNKSRSVFERLCLHITPAKMKRLTDITTEGAVKRVAFPPAKTKIPGEQGFNFYQWQAINTDNSLESLDSFRFFVQFEAKPLSRHYKLLPWIGLLAFILALIKFLK
jgi:hypothetical protein